eukprot:4637694-Prymnesium_polylepis.1
MTPYALGLEDRLAKPRVRPCRRRQMMMRQRERGRGGQRGRCQPHGATRLRSTLGLVPGRCP